MKSNGTHAGAFTCRHTAGQKRQRMRRLAHEFVRSHFLLTRHLRDYLTTLLCLDHPEGSVLVA